MEAYREECCVTKEVEIRVAGPVMLSNASHHQELGRGKEGFNPESQRDHNPVVTFMLDVLLLEL